MTHGPHDASVPSHPGPETPDEPEIEEVMKLRDRILTPLVALDLISQAKEKGREVESGLKKLVLDRITANALREDIEELCCDAYLDCHELGRELASIPTGNSLSTLKVDHDRLDEAAGKLDAAIHAWARGGKTPCAGD